MVKQAEEQQFGRAISEVTVYPHFAWQGMSIL